MFLFTKKKTIFFYFGQPVSAPADAISDENHELALLRECNSITEQSEENDNTDKGIQNLLEVAYCLCNHVVITLL